MQAVNFLVTKHARDFMTNPIHFSNSRSSIQPSNASQNSNSPPSLPLLDYRSTLLLSEQPGEGNFCGGIVEKLSNLWKWILSFFASNNQSSSTIPAVQNMIDVGDHFITRVLGEDNVREFAPCKIAIIAKLNQQIISQHLTVAAIETLSAVRTLAVQQLTQNLLRYGRNHQINPLDGIKIEAYLLKSNHLGSYDIKYEYFAQSNGSGCDQCLGLSRAEAIQYFNLKYENESDSRDNFIRFMTRE